MNDEKEISAGCLIFLLVTMVVLFTVGAQLYFKTRCYDFHTKYHYETRYNVGGGCEALIGEKWTRVWGSYTLHVDDIVKYLPEAE